MPWIVWGSLLPVPALAAQNTVRIVAGTTDEGRATLQWLAMLRRRLTEAEYAVVADVVRRYTPAERAWADLIHARAPLWEGEIPRVAWPYRPAAGPDTAVVVLGNRGASDAFTHDPTTIGFDLAALQAAYGDARRPENSARIDRFFRHEYAHLLQKAWLGAHPFDADSPLRWALADIWMEGLGNYHSLSERWRSRAGAPTATAVRTMDVLGPRFVARLAGLACASPALAEALTADLSWGPFTQKWGALPAALWLDAEAEGDSSALRAFVLAGPEGVWGLAERHLPRALGQVLQEARMAEQRCRNRREDAR